MTENDMLKQCAAFFQACEHMDCTQREHDPYFSLSTLEPSLSNEVARNAFLYLGCNRTPGGPHAKNIAVIATRIEHYYLSRKDTFLELATAAIRTDENFIKRIRKASQGYIDATMKARHRIKTNIKENTKNNLKKQSGIQIPSFFVTTSSPFTLPSRSQPPHQETIDLETLAIFLAAQRLKLQQLGDTSDMGYMNDLASFVLNGEMLTYQERMTQVWLAHSKLLGQENVLWEAYSANRHFATIPKEASSLNSMDKFADEDFYFFNLMESLGNLDDIKSGRSAQQKPTFFDSKESYFTVYRNALVMEAAHSAYLKNLDIGVPVTVTSGRTIHKIKGA